MGVLDSLKSAFPDAPWPNVLGNVTPSIAIGAPRPTREYSIRDHIVALYDGARVVSQYQLAIPVNKYPPDALQAQLRFQYTTSLRILIDGQVIEGPGTLEGGFAWTISRGMSSNPDHPEWNGKDAIIEQVSPTGAAPPSSPPISPEPMSMGRLLWP